MSARAEKRFLAGVGSRPSVTHFAESFPKIPALVAHGTRCGKLNCRCAAGHLHATRYLRWREGAVQRRRYVRAADVSAVRAILKKRREQRHAERLAFALSLRSWRELSTWVAEYEAQLQAERKRL